jgi:hypothetical protein
MACVTIHHWDPSGAGLAELRRVSRGPVVVFTFELESLPAWQHEFLHEGAWDAEHGHLRARDSFDGALRLVISETP